jgi:hypothetical protein
VVIVVMDIMRTRVVPIAVNVVSAHIKIGVIGTQVVRFVVRENIKMKKPQPFVKIVQ